MTVLKLPYGNSELFAQARREGMWASKVVGEMVYQILIGDQQAEYISLGMLEDEAENAGGYDQVNRKLERVI